MRARLVADLRGAAFDLGFEQVEGPFVDGRFGALADFGDLFAQLIGGRLIANFRQHVAHPLQERINLTRRVADHRVGQHRQQAKIVRRLIVLLQLPQVTLRLPRFLEQGREHQQHLLIELAGEFSAILLPGIELLLQELVHPPFVERLIDANHGPLIGVAAIGRQIPAGERPVRLRSQLVSDFDRFEQGDRLGNRTQFGQHVARQPAASGYRRRRHSSTR